MLEEGLLFFGNSVTSQALPCLSNLRDGVLTGYITYADDPEANRQACAIPPKPSPRTLDHTFSRVPEWSPPASVCQGITMWKMIRVVTRGWIPSVW